MGDLGGLGLDSGAGDTMFPDVAEVKELEAWLIPYIKLGNGPGPFPKGLGLDKGMRMRSSIAFVSGR